LSRRPVACSTEEDSHARHQHLGSLGEFIGGIAVVVSLIYLASQIRQNSKLLRASTASATRAQVSDVGSLMVQDPEVGRIYREGGADRSSLSEGDRTRCDAILSMEFHGLNQEHEFAAEDLIGPRLWQSRVRFMRRTLQQPGTREWWNEERGILDDDFREFVDGLIREIEATE
jgi:hypothetical protein